MQEPQGNREIHILDIRPQDESRKLADQIVQGLDAPFNKKIFPMVVLWDEVGLVLYDKFVTESPGYYPFGAELEIFQKHGDEIIQAMHDHTDGAIVPDEAIVELGAGSLRKTSHLLRALSDVVPTTLPVPPVTYFALDLDCNELRRTLNEIHNSSIGPSLSGKVETKGLWGTFESGFEFIGAGGLDISRKGDEDESTPRAAFGTDSTSATSLCQPPVHFLFLGGTIGSFHRGEDAQFLRTLPLRSGGTLLLGLSHDNKREELEAAYNDPKGYNRVFALNGLSVAGKAFGNPNLFDRNNWDSFKRYDQDKRCIEGFYKCLRSHEVDLPGYSRSVQFLEGELVRVTLSTKYSERDTSTLFTDAQLQPIQHWTDSTNRHSLWLLERPQIVAEHSSSA